MCSTGVGGALSGDVYVTDRLPPEFILSLSIQKIPALYQGQRPLLLKMPGQTKAAVYTPEFSSEQVKDPILGLLVKEVVDPPAVSTWLKKR